MRARAIAGVDVLHELRPHHRLLLHRTPAPLLQRDGAVSVLNLAPDTPVGLTPDTRRVGADARTARRCRRTPAGGLALTTGFQGPARPARVVRIRPDTTDWGSVDNTKDISSAGIHAGAALGVLPALAVIVAGGRSTDVKSVLRNGAVVESSLRSSHPLPWWNTPSAGENHVSDAEGRLVYNGSDAGEMFRLYADEVQADAEAEVVARRAADHPRRRGRRSLLAWPAGLASRVRGLLNRR